MSLEKLKEIELVISDVDGVMTNGSIISTPDGEAKTFSVRDGLGIVLLQKAGVRFAILSGRDSKVLRQRAEELKIAAVKTGRIDKQTAFEEIIADLDVQAHKVAYIGDDLPDLAPIRLAGRGYCPRDAAAEVIEAADEVVPVDGGCGVVRYIVEQILKSRGVWDEIVAGFEVKP